MRLRWLLLWLIIPSGLLAAEEPAPADQPMISSIGRPRIGKMRGKPSR